MEHTTDKEVRMKKSLICLGILVCGMAIISSTPINVHAEQVSAEDFHIPDSEWENMKKEIIARGDYNWTDGELLDLRREVEYGEWEKKYGLQVRKIDGVDYIYKMMSHLQIHGLRRAIQMKKERY